MTGKKSRPYCAAVASILACSVRRYLGIREGFESACIVISFPLSQEVLDAPDDAVLVADLGRDHAFVLSEMLAQVLDELPGAVGAFDLTISEEIHARENRLLHDLHARQRVVHAPVVAVREMERIDVPFLGRVVVVHHLRAELVRARNHRAARFPRVEERVAIDLTRDGVVNDVAALEALVVAAEPRVDPEALDPDDFLLLVAHRARNVHHVDDDGIGNRLRAFLPGPITLVLALRNDDGVRRIVDAARNRTAQRLSVGPFEVAERLGTGATNPRVTILRAEDSAATFVLDGRKLELFA